MIKNKTVRILAIAPLSRGLGYAVMEGPENLVACGNKAILRDKNAGALTDERKVQELEREIMDLKITNRGKDMFIDQLKNERGSFFDQLLTANRKMGELDNRLLQMAGKNGSDASLVVKHAEIAAYSGE